MTSQRAISDGSRPRGPTSRFEPIDAAGHRPPSWRGRIAGALALVAAGILPAAAQTGPMAPGDAVVTGFSGFRPVPGMVAPPGDPLATFFIDTEGASAQVFRLQPSGPPQAQLINAPPVLKVLAGQVGQVFAIALAPKFPAVPGAAPTAPVPPDIYLGATSAFGIQIVKPGAGGQPERTRTGDPAASFMAGQFGSAPGAGPGSIWRVDGATGAASLFATIPGNSGPGLGDVVHDHATRQFFASDLDTGLIHRLDANGAPLDTFDHGVAGRPARGLPPVADDGAAMDIRNPAFNSENVATWGFTPPARMVYGMAVHAGRLYYTVAEGAQVWSVGVGLDGAFAADPRFELDVPGVAPGNLLTDLIFDTQGRLYVAQRGAPRGSHDYSVFAAKTQQAEVKRFRREVPDNPTTPGTWVPAPEEYAIGFPDTFRNANGGVALGHDHDPATGARRNACSAYVWSTGENLRNNPAFAAQLAAGGPPEVNGLQGNAIALVRPQNAPPLSTYFVDYDGQFGDAERAGHLGDVEIWQVCEGVPGLPGFGFWWPGYSWPPVVELPPGWTPPQTDTFNLRLRKRAITETCIAGGGGYLCAFAIRVTNAGTTPYFGPITVRDELPSAPPGATMSFFFQPPWACAPVGPAAHQCTLPAVLLNPGEGVDLFVVVQLPTSYLECSLDNIARIVWPFGFGDANPWDDIDGASASVPAPNCTPQGNQTNLRLRKDPIFACSQIAGGDIGCWYRVRVQNQGPATYTGNITVEDTVPPGSTGVFALTPPWACAGGPPTYNCTRGVVNLMPGQVVQLFVGVRISVPNAIQLGCQLRNNARITFAPGGSPQNINPGDDQDDATHVIPANICMLPVPMQQQQQQQPLPPPPASCPPGFTLQPDGTCGRRTAACPSGWTSAPAPVNCCPPGRPWTGQQCGRDIPPPPPPQCERGWTRAPAPVFCCPPGRPWTGQQCGRDLPPPPPPPTCGPNQTGVYPNCCTAPAVWDGRRCVTPPIRVCPPDSIGQYPNCRCRPGTTGTPGNCVPIVTPPPPAPCPQGFVGTPPNCRRVVTPPPAPCPQGFVGTPPNCRRVVTPPPAPCPQGFVGTPPNCRRVVTPPPVGSGIRPTPCPQGFIGTPPNCRRQGPLI